MEGEPKPIEPEPEPEAELTENQTRFLNAVREEGYISHAALLAELDRGNHYRWLAESPAYTKAFKDASTQFDDSLRSEAVRRGKLGVIRAIYYKGLRCGEEVEYSDRLLELLLKSRCPEFQEKHVLSTADDKPIEVKVIAIRYPEKEPDPQKWMETYRPKDKTPGQ